MTKETVVSEKEEIIAWHDLKLNANGKPMEVPTIYVYECGKFAGCYVDWAQARVKQTKTT